MNNYILKFKNLVSSQQGIAALLVVIIISTVALIMAMNASLLGLGEIDMAYTSQKGNETLIIADGCLEAALFRLKLDALYTGETLNLGDGSCIINVSASGNNRTISISSTVDIYNKKIQAEATLTNERVTLTSWQEING